MQPVHLFVPVLSSVKIHGRSKQDAREFVSWLEKLPELSLVAPLEIHAVEWSNLVTGTTQDWFEMAKRIQEVWNQAGGVVVWAPERSLLELAGFLSLLFEVPGKPIVAFAAPQPLAAVGDEFGLMEIKSALINAAYVACADLGEVCVLSGQSLLKPSSCQWTADQQKLSVQSVQKPIATIDFQLKLQGEYHSREKSGALNPFKALLFSNEIPWTRWLPGVSAQSCLPASKPKSLVVEAEAYYWQTEEMQSMQKMLQKQAIPTIWYSHAPWKQGKEKSLDLFIAHERNWWVTMLVQYAFGRFGEVKKSFNFIEGAIQKGL